MSFKIGDEVKIKMISPYSPYGYEDINDKTGIITYTYKAYISTDEKYFFIYHRVEIKETKKTYDILEENLQYNHPTKEKIYAICMVTKTGKHKIFKHINFAKGTIWTSDLAYAKKRMSDLAKCDLETQFMLITTHDEPTN